jgi:TetR/AcrR family transcriptional regulator, cholesterol catabolism regulator
MTKELSLFIDNIRTLANEKGISSITLERLYENPDFSNELLAKHFKNDEILVKHILASERNKFEIIFVDHDFDGYYDAIDILFTVSKEMAAKFYNLSPSVTYSYKEQYPKIYENHLKKRIDFIFGKIQVNLHKGISEGMYRDDVSIELVARRYISRLLDLHDPENFPPEDFSFTTLFMQMFDSFVKSIATEKGIKYYNEKRKTIKF